MIEELKKLGKIITINKDTYICQEGFELNNVYIILSGSCKIFRLSETGKVMSFGFYNNSGIIGDLETFSDSNIAETSVLCTSEITCIKISLEKSKQLIKTNIEYSNNLAKTLAQKLTSSSIQTTQNILLPLEDRLIIYLKNSYPNNIFSGNLTHISQELGTSYRHLLRVIKKLKENNILIPIKDSRKYKININ